MPPANSDALVNRALPSPWSLWCDHSESMGERDQGWIQLYVENSQEALDFVLLGYKLAEHHKVLLPVMVCMDGFFVSHTTEALDLPEQEEVDSYLPPYKPQNLVLDPENPMALNVLTSPEIFTEIKHQHKTALDGVLNIFYEVSGEFKKAFGRSYSPVDSFMCEDAELGIVSMGGISGVVRHVVKEKRARGRKIGMIKLTCFRPFSGQALMSALKDARGVAVIDRSAGLGGRDVTVKTIEKVISCTEAAVENNDHSCLSRWIDLKEGVEGIYR